MGQLVGDGHELTPHPAEADVIVVNTCSFIDPAKQESVDTILEMAEYKKTRQGAAAGCSGMPGRALPRRYPQESAGSGCGPRDERIVTDHRPVRRARTEGNGA